MARSTVHVSREKDRWHICQDGSTIGSLSTRDEAIEAARMLAQRDAPATLIIDGIDNQPVQTEQHDPL